MQNAELLARLDAFSIDEPGADFTFTQRLARENGWTRSFAERVVQEYKRFAFLAVAAGHPVTPFVTLIIVTTVISALLFLRRTFRTLLGDKVLRATQDAYRSGYRAEQTASSTPALVPLSVALFGVTALSGTVYASLEERLTPPSRADGGWGGSSCGSSCGGGGSSGCGGGSGCGGCGGN